MPQRNMTLLSRAAKIRAMGLKAQQLLADGYTQDADMVLDEMIALRERWALEDDINGELSSAEAA